MMIGSDLMIKSRERVLLKFVTDVTSARAVIKLIKKRNPNVNFLVIPGELYAKLESELGHNGVYIEGIHLFDGEDNI